MACFEQDRSVCTTQAHTKWTEIYTYMSSRAVSTNTHTHTHTHVNILVCLLAMHVRTVQIDAVLLARGQHKHNCVPQDKKRGNFCMHIYKYFATETIYV
jgi:hypothetical protein